ncbi:TPA: glycosyltransferase [Photobacterium damselae]
MKISIVSFSDSMGGAARAAHRLYCALKKNNLKCNMLVKNKHIDDVEIICEESKHKIIKNKILNRISMFLIGLQKNRNVTLHSLNIFGSDVFNLIEKSDSDIVNIHWVNYETLSLKQISKIKKPIVLTLHDMWAFCGTEHLSVDSEFSDFRLGYNNLTKDSNYLSGINFDKYIWKKKLECFPSNMTIVCPSKWLAHCAKESKIFKNFNIHVIPNPLDTEKFKPLDSGLAKKSLQLPLNKKLIGFGAMGGGIDPNKGFDLLLNALNKLENKQDYICVIFGQSEPKKTIDISIEQIYLGHIYDDEILTLFYNAIDVMVVPSRQENLPQTATEAQSCGTPVVGFDTSGMPDVVLHKETGYLAKKYDVKDLAYGINWCISNKSELSLPSRKYAEKRWSLNVVSNKYSNLFMDIING